MAVDGYYKNEEIAVAGLVFPDGSEATSAVVSSAIVLPPTSLFVPGLGTDFSAGDYNASSEIMPQGKNVAAFLFSTPYILNIKQIFVGLDSVNISGYHAWFGFYDIKGNLLASSGAWNIPQSSSGNANTIPLVVTLTPGSYYFAWSSDDVTEQTAVVCVASSSAWFDDHNDYGYYGRNNGAMGFAVNQITANDLPATLGGSAGGGGSVLLSPQDINLPFALCGI